MPFHIPFQFIICILMLGIMVFNYGECIVDAINNKEKIKHPWPSVSFFFANIIVVMIQLYAFYHKD